MHVQNAKVIWTKMWDHAQQVELSRDKRKPKICKRTTPFCKMFDGLVLASSAVV